MSNILGFSLFRLACEVSRFLVVLYSDRIVLNYGVDLIFCVYFTLFFGL